MVGRSGSRRPSRYYRKLGRAVSPVPLLNHEALGLFRVELELRNGLGLGRLCVGCLDIAKVLSAGAENCDAPPPELSGGGPILGRSNFFEG
jgi:hypothetical protein